MIEITNSTSDEDETVRGIRSLSRFDVKMMYWDLKVPDLQEVSGEYDAFLLDQGDFIGSFLTKVLFRSQGPWRGKAFRPISESSGEGYNLFGSEESPRTVLRMDTYIGHSQIVPGFAYILDYRRRNFGPIRWLLGEIRQVTPEILLGIGTFGPRGCEKARFRRVIPFILKHSRRRYRA